MTALLQILWLSLIPVAATGAGALVASWRPPGARVKSGIQHFAAGVVFAVVAVELLPDVIRTHTPLEVAVGFAAGIGLMLLLRHWTDAAQGPHNTPAGADPVSRTNSAPGPVSESVSTGLLVAVGIDILIDGLLLGIAFAAGAKEGVLLTLALSMELLSLGLAIVATLLENGASRARAVVVPVLLSGLLCVGAVIGDTILKGASQHVLAGVLSFGCAALLFLVTEELLVEAHEVPETPATTAMFFTGFLLFLLLGMLG